MRTKGQLLQLISWNGGNHRKPTCFSFYEVPSGRVNLIHVVPLGTEVFGQWEWAHSSQALASMYRNRYQNYSQGEWQVARTLLSKTHGMLGEKDTTQTRWCDGGLVSWDVSHRSRMGQVVRSCVLWKLHTNSRRLDVMLLGKKYHLDELWRFWCGFGLSDQQRGVKVIQWLLVFWILCKLRHQSGGEAGDAELSDVTLQNLVLQSNPEIHRWKSGKLIESDRGWIWCSLRRPCFGGWILSSLML